MRLITHGRSFITICSSRLFEMYRRPLAIIFLAVVALTVVASATYWSSRVDANSTHWSIYRESLNVSFDLSSSVEGTVSPVKYRDRSLNPYQSYYEEIGANDVQLRQRTSALEGEYKSADKIGFESHIYPDELEITIDKPAGTPVYTIEYKNEIWPVFIKASRTLSYKGQQINNRDFVGNNGDFAGTNFLYNRELSKEQRSILWLQRMNATVYATDDAILLAEFKPTKYLGNLIQARSTGIADLNYKQRDYKYDVKHQNYPAVSEGRERYYGDYALARKIEMRSTFEEHDPIDEDLAENWLPCCYEGWNGMIFLDQKDLGMSLEKVFDCTCPNPFA